MYDNSNLAIRCRALWADVLCAVESRVWSINDYVKDTRSQLDCQMLSSDSVLIEHPSVKRTLVATLDLDEHAIHVKELNGDGVHREAASGQDTAVGGIRFRQDREIV